jgi:hypothetical protein
MAYASELTGAFPPGQASAIGGQYTGLAAAGSSQATGTPVTASMSVVTAADGTKAVTLKGQKGDEVWLFNDSASTLKVYPPVGAAIAVVGTGVGTVNAAFDHLTYKAVIYKCFSSTQWVPMVSA